jgi:hypothetical protein
MAPTTTSTAKPSLATQITNFLLGLGVAAAEIAVKNPEHAGTAGEIIGAAEVLIPALLAILMPAAPVAATLPAVEIAGPPLAVVA